MSDPLQNSPHLPSIAAGALAAWGAYAMLRPFHSGCAEAGACIDCGRCDYTGPACPGAIENIAALLAAARSLDANSFVDHRGLACIRCGKCNEWCPLGVDIPLALGAMQQVAMEAVENGGLRTPVVASAFAEGKIGAEFIEPFSRKHPLEGD